MTRAERLPGRGAEIGGGVEDVPRDALERDEDRQDREGQENDGERQEDGVEIEDQEGERLRR